MGKMKNLVQLLSEIYDLILYLIGPLFGVIFLPKYLSREIIVIPNLCVWLVFAYCIYRLVDDIIFVIRVIRYKIYKNVQSTNTGK